MNKRSVMVSAILAAVAVVTPTATAEPANPDGLVAAYHLTTKDGWSNDLQSIVWNEKAKHYDLYFLHSADGAENPLGPKGQDWYHTTTTDFVHFTDQKQAIPASGGHTTDGWKSAWTGSVINRGGTPTAYISGLKKTDGSQNIWAVASTDGGATFTKPLNDGKPVLDITAPSASVNRTDERDPYVFTYNGKTLMYVAEGDHIGVYRSTDGIRWTKADAAAEAKIQPATFFRGRTWSDNAPIECPVLKTMKTPAGDKQVLFFGAKDASRGETTGTYYTVGHLDANGMFVADTDTQRLDHGPDYYGANFTGSTDISTAEDTITSLGWVGNWNYTADGVHAADNGSGPYLRRLGSYSLARELTLGADNCITQKLKTSDLKYRNVKTHTGVTKDKPVSASGKPWVDRKDTNGDVYGLYDVPNQDAAQKHTLRFRNMAGNYTGRIYIDLWQGGDWVRFNYDPTDGWYNVKARAGELDNSKKGQDSTHYYFDGLLGNGNGYSAQSLVQDQRDITLEVYTDTTSVEFVFPNGHTFTIARFSQSDKQDFKVFTEDPTGKNTVDIEVGDVGR